MFLKEVSYAQQGCIIKTVTLSNSILPFKMVVFYLKISVWHHSNILLMKHLLLWPMLKTFMRL